MVRAVPRPRVLPGDHRPKGAMFARKVLAPPLNAEQKLRRRKCTLHSGANVLLR